MLVGEERLYVLSGGMVSQRAPEVAQVARLIGVHIGVCIGVYARCPAASAEVEDVEEEEKIRQSGMI